MADALEWLRVLGLASKEDYAYWGTRSLRREAETTKHDLQQLGEQHGGAIDELQAQVRRLQVTLAVVVEALAETHALDPAKLGPRLAASLRAAGIRDPRSEGAKPASPTDPSATMGATTSATTTLVCASCGNPVTIANSFMRGDARVCEACY